MVRHFQTMLSDDGDSEIGEGRLVCWRSSGFALGEFPNGETPSPLIAILPVPGSGNGEQPRRERRSDAALAVTDRRVALSKVEIQRL